MRKLIFIAFMVMSVCGYAQKYEVGTTTAVWKAPAAADFLHAKATGVKYVEVAFNQCYRGVPVDEVIPRIKEMKAKIDSADIEVWSIHLPFSRTLDISVLDDRLEGRCRFYGRDDRIVCHVPTDLPGFASKFGTDSR